MDVQKIVRNEYKGQLLGLLRAYLEYDRSRSKRRQSRYLQRIERIARPLLQRLAADQRLDQGYRFLICESLVELSFNLTLKAVHRGRQQAERVRRISDRIRSIFEAMDQADFAAVF